MNPKPPRKSSRSISLVLLGAAALAGCGDDIETRDVYATRADCVQDWGEEQKCEPVRDGRYHSSYFYGPRYVHSGGWGWSSRPSSTTARSGSHAVASSHVSRGGFGHSASSHSSGGG